MTRNEILRTFPKATESFIRANVSDDYCRKAAKLESNPSDAPLEKKEVQRPDCERFLVRVESVRKRLLDEDNLCPKYVVDLCRYAGIIPCDSPEKVSIETRQRRCKKGEQEKIEITVDKLDHP